MQTRNIEISRNKVKIVSEFLDGLCHFETATGLTSYFAAKAAINGNLRAGTERRCMAIKKALKAFNVVVSIALNDRGLPAVRVYAPTKQSELFF